MNRRQEKAALKRALREAGLGEWYYRAVSILYSVNGFENAMEYIGIVTEKTRIEHEQSKPRQLELL